MSTQAIRRSAKDVAAATDNYEVKHLALLVARLCDVVDAHDTTMTVAMNNLEVEERLGVGR